MKKLLIVLLISVLFLCTKSIAKEYIIGVEKLDYMPYYSGKGKEYKGFIRDLLDAFAKEKGYTFKYKPLPVRRLFNLFINKKVDFKFPDNPNWKSGIKKGKDVIYSDIVIKTIDGVLVLPENKGKGIKGLKKLGTVMGFTPWPYKKMIDKGKIKSYENPNFQGLLKQVLAGKISGAYINVVVAAYQLDKKLNKAGDLVYDPGLPSDRSNFLMSTIKHKDVITLLNKYLVKNKKFVKSLKKKYEIK
ncbi:MAG: transporter substrate-binding domain-containing protein [Deltaproteobacteria bacterium]|nr:transporter substrate-binding domain-containing protein [Deltaproteobacteria bacterium]